MAEQFLRTMLTPAVRDAQRRHYGRSYPEYGSTMKPDELGPSEIAFLQERDSFYMATVTEDGWPYLQHRGGPVGFFKAISPTQLAFADYGGNRQLISVGSISRNNRVALFAMDYPARTRLKVIGHAEILAPEEHLELAADLVPAGGQPAKPERLVRIKVLSFDWNCPKFITPRYTADEVEAAVDPLRKRIAELEAALKASQPGS
jgi:uncharacterized protein